LRVDLTDRPAGRATIGCDLCIGGRGRAVERQNPADKILRQRTSMASASRARRFRSKVTPPSTGRASRPEYEAGL
jgi:hypothetical protein